MDDLVHLATITEAWECSAWKRFASMAVQHPYGRGALEGVWYEDFSKYYKRVARKDIILGGRALSIGQGALWDPVRKTANPYEACPMCGVSPCDWKHIS